MEGAHVYTYVSIARAPHGGIKADSTTVAMYTMG